MLNSIDLDIHPIPGKDLIEIEKDYQIIKEIDTGGFSIVFKAFSYFVNDLCALKVISKFDRSGNNKQPFIAKEIRILQELNHPMIIRLLSYDIYSQSSCIVLELCERGSLEELVRRSRLSEYQIKRYIVDIATGLDYMHSQNIIHRDLKLDNILLTSDDSIKITDFGLATGVSPHGLASGDVGCPWDKAPEMITQASYDNSVDWWSLGIILFKMFTGTHPFRAGKSFSMISKDLSLSFTMEFPY
ncbi:kinase-like domain-containing protein [Melampsora americana]|nr:kinase-like domain-containing protein [Melampsora americana]